MEIVRFLRGRSSSVIDLDSNSLSLKWRRGWNNWENLSILPRYNLNQYYNKVINITFNDLRLLWLVFLKGSNASETHFGILTSKIKSWARCGSSPSSLAQELEGGGSDIQDLPHLWSKHKASLGNLLRSCLQIKEKEGWEYTLVVECLPILCKVLKKQKRINLLKLYKLLWWKLF